MRAFLQRQQPVIVTAVVVGTLVAFGPGVAQAAYDAVNADKVDGKHAVGAGATISGRAGKLVATDAEGRLPNNIIATAPNAAKLAGVGALGWLRDLPGSVDGENILNGSVTPQDLTYGATWPAVYGMVHLSTGEFGDVDNGSSGFEDTDVLRVPDGAGGYKTGIWCITGLPVSPVAVNASSNINYGGPSIVSSSLGEAGECADIPDVEVQVSVFTYAFQGLHPAYDASFNLQVWGVPTS